MALTIDSPAPPQSEPLPLLADYYLDSKMYSLHRLPRRVIVTLADGAAFGISIVSSDEEALTVEYSPRGG